MNNDILARAAALDREINMLEQRADAGSRLLKQLLAPDRLVGIMQAFATDEARTLNELNAAASKIAGETFVRYGRRAAQETLGDIQTQINLLWAMYQRQRLRELLASQTEYRERKERYAKQNANRL